MKLDLASGPNPASGFLGVDLAPVTDHQFDLTRYTWPFPDNSVEELRCSHFIEHIPTENVIADNGRKDCFFHFFDEAFRILIPGGIFTVTWPALHSVPAFQDPTHRRFIPPETLHYLSKQWRLINNLSHYNVTCDWQIKLLTLTETARDRTLWHQPFAEYTATLTKA